MSHWSVVKPGRVHALLSGDGQDAPFEREKIDEQQGIQKCGIEYPTNTNMVVARSRIEYWCVAT